MNHLKPYPAYKDSGLPWLGSVPDHWDVNRGKWLFEKMDRLCQEKDEVVTCFRDGVVTLRKNRRVRGFTESLKEIGYQGIRKGDLVIHAMDAFAGAIGVADSDGKGTPVYQVLKPTERANAYFFAYTIREMSRNQWILALATGIRERSTDFRYSDFASQFLPLPSISEQNAIVSYLDHMNRRIRRYINTKKKLIALLNEQKQAIIHQAVTRGLDTNVPLKPSGVEWLGDIPERWVVKPLKWWVKINQDTLPEDTDPDYEFTYFDIGTVGTSFLLKQPEHMRFGNAPSRARRILQKNDTIVSTVRTYLKSVFFISEDIPNLIASTGFAVLTPNLETIPEYFSSLIQDSTFVNQVMVNSTGVLYPAITETRLASLNIAIPPDKLEQQAVTKYIKDETKPIIATITHARREIEFLHEYSTRLIADIVTGKLDVREAAASVPEEAENELDIEEVEENELIEEGDYYADA